MEKVYSVPSTKHEVVGGFCPGCLHGVVVKLVCEVQEELGILDRTVCVVGVGCCCITARHWKCDVMNAPHGRAPAVATGLKRMAPKDTVVYTYQGDGDLASIGIAETIYAANRGENFTVIFINNSTYGMTGGQMAPTTLVGQKATTAPFGRDPKQHGYPVHVCELLATLKAPAYLERVTCVDAPNIMKTKAAIKKAFQNQIDGKGFSLVEVMSNCPTNWGMTPLETLEYVKENTLKEFPLGVYRDR